MAYYLMYRFGYFLAMTLPLKTSYAIACFISDICYLFSPSDRKAVIENLRVVTGKSDERELDIMAREVFRNFGKYLVDFFRFTKIDDEYLRRFIKIEGLDNIDNALAKGRGVIALSAHIGNWELGGFALSLIRHPMMAVVLTHKNKRVNDFFTRQRTISKLIPVEIGLSLRGCYGVLKSNGLLALLGDRDFSSSGIRMNFFGKDAVMPRGPAVFSARLGAEIVPSFMVREKDDTFRMFFEPPIELPVSGDEESRVREIMRRYIAVIEKYVALYPTQWYMFKRAWNGQ
jgi:KDO2-lipid IV(A) lauroyltransferase